MTSQEAVIIGDGFTELEPPVCEVSATVTDEQRQAFGRNVYSLVCSMPNDHEGAMHYDRHDNVTWMFLQDWRESPPDEAYDSLDATEERYSKSRKKKGQAEQVWDDARGSVTIEYSAEEDR